MERKISSVIIDTSAYYKAQCDFAGINNSIIPMFLRLLKANGIQLLTHPILEYEIRKHIKDSALVKRATELETQVKRCKDQLLLVGVSQAEWLERIADMNIEKRLADQCYYFTAYTHVDFVGASAYVDCEIQIDFSPDGGTYQSKITRAKTVNKWDIAVDLADADTTEEDITDYGERDYLADQADAQEDYFNH